MTRLEVDVVVVGGGPAGSVFATRMAQLGFSVCVIERAEFPRRHLGESLSPGVMPMLASIGSRAPIHAAGFPRVTEVSTNWEGEEAIRHDPRAQGMLVDRGSFDQLLLERAADTGVTILQPAQVLEARESAAEWELRVGTTQGAVEVRAHFLADATGRAARFGGARRAMGPRTIAIHGYWTGDHLPSRPRIEAGEHEWYWGVPIPDGSYNTQVFVDAKRFRSEPGATLGERLQAFLARSSLMRETRVAMLLEAVRAADATPYVDDEPATARQIRIGDAALAIDPLSSSGVQKAIQTALSGAIVANTLLREPSRHDAAIQFHRQSIADAATRHRNWAAGHYAVAALRFGTRFWTDRAGAVSPDDLRALIDANSPVDLTVGDDVPVRLAPDAQWDDVPCLGTHLVEMRSALRHPNLDGPVAYVGGQELVPLLREVRSGLTLRGIADRWADVVPLESGLRIARWLSSHGVLEPGERFDQA